MSTVVDKLLEPVSADQPCGPDLFYDPRFEELETLLKGKPEVEIGSIVKPAEPPDWVELRDRSIDFLKTSKHLRPAVILACAWLKLEGLPGFLDGLKVVHGLVETYWTTVHPVLDPEDNNDPQQRLNILRGLTSPRGSETGWLQMVEYLHNVPLSRPKGVPPITLEIILNAAAGRPAGEGADAAKTPSSAAIATQVRSSDLAEVARLHGLAKECLETLGALDAFLGATLGASGTISFEEVEGVLRQIVKVLAGFLPEGTGEVAGSSEETASGSAPAAGFTISGSIRSREDVLRALDSVCAYYRQVEPGSPVPLILQRARKLATMDFLQAMHELNLANVDQLRPSLGSVVDEFGGGSSTTRPAE
jgi:type VI secretion system protein ImpA